MVLRILAGILVAGLAVATAAAEETASVTSVTPLVAGAPAEAGKGPVTSLPLPRYVTLKTDEGYARRGPSLSHRIDWVFTRAGMPLKVTAEFEHWRRVEDADGAGGWVHYTLLSGTRSVLVTGDMTELRDAPEPDAAAVVVAEYGVIGRLLACTRDWCRVSVEGTRAWAPKSALWGVEPDEVFD